MLHGNLAWRCVCAAKQRCAHRTEELELHTQHHGLCHLWAHFNTMPGLQLAGVGLSISAMAVWDGGAWDPLQVGWVGTHWEAAVPSLLKLAVLEWLQCFGIYWKAADFV